jgi:hypothetical protein
VIGVLGRLLRRRRLEHQLAVVCALLPARRAAQIDDPARVLREG